jgi:hypothetical protein
MRAAIPLKERPYDLALLAFFGFNLLFVTYGISLEQIAIADPSNFTPPLWPPQALVSVVHWWEKSFDPLLWARPAWYRATIWLDVLFFGPFYVAALYAYSRGRDWIRMPSVIWAAMMLTNVFIILFDEINGTHATPRPLVVAVANASWLLVPLAVLWRVVLHEHPFTRSVDGEGSGKAAQGAP